MHFTARTAPKVKADVRKRKMKRPTTRIIVFSGLAVLSYIVVGASLFGYNPSWLMKEASAEVFTLTPVGWMFFPVIIVLILISCLFA